MEHFLVKAPLPYVEENRIPDMETRLALTAWQRTQRHEWFDKE